MPISAELKDRLASAHSTDGLAPLVSTGPVGERVAGAAGAVRREFDEPVMLGAGGELAGMQLSAGDEVLAAVKTLIRAQPADADVAVNLFGRAPDPPLEGFQSGFLQAAFLGTTLLAAAGDFSDERLDDLIRLSASISAAGVLLRDLLVDPDRQPPPIDPPRDGNPFVPGIPEELFIAAERLRRRGCANAAKTAMGKWGAGVAAAVPRYLPDAIDELDPPDACPDQTLAIRGRSLGDGTGMSVVFTGFPKKPVVVPETRILAWTDREIDVRIPQEAFRGPVGILQWPRTAGEPIGALASEAIGELGQCFGPAATARLEGALGKLAPPISPPPAQANGANIYRGGRPIVHSYAAAPSTTLWPGRRITLAWDVEGATRVEIVTRNVAGSAVHELPAITSALGFPRGTVSVTVPGTRRWRGQYVLRATNACGTSESTAEFEMALRRGLALGGGGTRGDFQVGALLYLYDEKGFRPEAIAGTSVGSINSVDLVMGDDAATATSPARSAASRLAATWLSLTGNQDMWGEEPWLQAAKADVRRVLRSLSIEGLLALPYTVVSDTIAAADLAGVFEGRKGAIVAVFNLAPIEARMRATYDQLRADASGIKLRLVSVSVESSALIMVDEKGGVLERGPIVRRPTNVSAANPTDVPDGAIASSTMPGIFPARRLKDHMCVDGGVREVVPAQVAVQDLGCNEVYALRCSAAPALKATDPTRPIGEVMARSVLDIAFDEIADDDVEPFNGWGDGVRVTTIRPSFNLHDPMVVEPGLIRIALDYGWMRAADVIDAANSNYARELSDRITLLRIENWKDAHWAAGALWLDPHRGFTDFAFGGISIPDDPEIRPGQDPAAVSRIRQTCRQIRSLIEQRLLIPVPTPPSPVRTRWFTQWELTPVAPPSNDPWAAYSGTLGALPAETPPATI